VAAPGVTGATSTAEQGDEQRVMGSFGFSVTTEWTNRTVVLLPMGDLDVMTAPDLGRVLTSVVDDADRVVLDLSGVRFVDCAGLAPVRRVLRVGRTSGTTVRLVGARPQVEKVLRLTGLARELRPGGS
jgi:anti-anti-sigma factor